MPRRRSGGDAGEPLAEFYRVFARDQGQRRIWLTPCQADKLEDIIEQATRTEGREPRHKVMDFLDQGLPPSPFDDLDSDDFLDLSPPVGVFRRIAVRRSL